MNNSEFLKIMADANRKCGYVKLADQLDNKSAVYEAEEIKQETREKNDGNVATNQ